MECGKSELQYDEPKIYQTDIEDDYFQILTPKNSLTPGNPIYFDIEGTTDFLDLSQSQLKLKLVMTKADDSAITDQMVAGPVNNVLHSLFSQIQVSLKDTIISHSNSMYPYRAYIENLLNYSKGAKETWMEGMGWSDDEYGKFDQAGNIGITNRRKYLLDKKKAEYKGRLHIDIGLQEKLLPSNLDVRITLTQSKIDFFTLNHLNPAADLKIALEDVSLWIRRVKLSPAKQISFEKEIAQAPINIPISYVAMKNITIASTVSSFNQDGVFTGPLPSRIILGLVQNEAFAGSKVLNPFNFKHYKVVSIGLRVNGKNLPTRHLQPDFEKGHVIDCYQTLFHALNRQFDNYDNAIDIPQYQNGSALYAFNLTPDQCPGAHPLQTGSVDITIRFADALRESVSLIVYSQFENNVFIDQHRNCFTNVHN